MNNIQERVERTIYESLRKKLVADGYIPDIADTARFPMDGNDNLTDIAEANWESDLKAIKASKGFAVEVFNNSSVRLKGQKQSPRVVIEPTRITPGDIGLALGGSTIKDGATFKKYKTPMESSHLEFDITLVSATTQQERYLNYLLFATLSTKGFIDFYDVPSDKLFLKQINYWDNSEPLTNDTEKIFTYVCPDLYLYDGSDPIEIVPITEIKVDEKTIEQTPITLDQIQSPIIP